ncbi:hypothetical protein BH20ACI4_BH20ACI4_09950 [soil metagenome]
MKRWKKITLVLLAVILAVQIPFIYNRFQTGNLADKILSLQNQRTNPVNQNYRDLKGVIHVHTSLGGHSTGGFDELIEGATGNNLDFVVMTEHTAANFDTSALTLNGFYKNTLFVGGNELDTKSGDRFLLINSDAEAALANQTETPEFLQKSHAKNQIAFITYPQDFKSWDADFDGIEIFSLHTNAKKMSFFTFPLDALWSYGAYPELTLAKYFARPVEHLQKYDEIAARRKITLFAGSDAHSNLGFHLFGDDAGNKFVNFKFDDYALVFRLVRTHVLLEKDKPLTRENLVAALKNGHTFIGFDSLSDTGGFSFSAENGTEQKIQGDEIALQNGVRFRAAAPQISRFVIFKNGEKIFEAGENTEAVFDAREPGAYRTEVYLDALGSPFDKMPWIVSNPIYIR